VEWLIVFWVYLGLGSMLGIIMGEKTTEEQLLDSIKDIGPGLREIAKSIREAPITREVGPAIEKHARAVDAMSVAIQKVSEDVSLARTAFNSGIISGGLGGLLIGFVVARMLFKREK